MQCNSTVNLTYSFMKHSLLHISVIIVDFHKQADGSQRTKMYCLTLFALGISKLIFSWFENVATLNDRQISAKMIFGGSFWYI